ncbi:hypothetical protein IGK47_002055 [Enterococcus sp. AZ007]|uniref:Alpha-ribazole kinase n=2 Tax=Enterococcus TaxID=1350 RepID=A0ABS3HFB9_9ENTE|nr:hypothetical protein [Enterococcus sp. MJM16]
MPMTKEYRDLSILPFSNESSLVIACDSSAGIGKKEQDVVTIDPAITAAFCLRVPLMELFCYGAVPIAVVDLIGNEYNPTGKQMLDGIKAELAKAGLSHLPLNGSTEENMLTKTTSLGITVIAQASAKKESFKMQEDCSLLQLGHPYVGEMVVKNQKNIFSYSLVKDIKKESGVLDMLPVGSKGIRYEAQLMAKNSEYHVIFSEEDGIDCSAGPATVILLAVKKKAEADILARYAEIKKIGEFKKE